MLRLIAAIDSMNGIAKDNSIPWDLPRDRVRFRTLTLERGANVLMGRKTYEVIGSYLKGRNNFIVSKEQIELPNNCQLVNDLKVFLDTFKEDLWVIGGADIYAQTIDVAEELYLTVINHDFHCDKFFPSYSGFKLKDNQGPFSENGLTFNYQLFTRF